MNLEVNNRWNEIEKKTKKQKKIEEYFLAINYIQYIWHRHIQCSLLIPAYIHRTCEFVWVCFGKKKKKKRKKYDNLYLQNGRFCAICCEKSLRKWGKLRTKRFASMFYVNQYDTPTNTCNIFILAGSFANDALVITSISI